MKKGFIKELFAIVLGIIAIGYVSCTKPEPEPEDYRQKWVGEYRGMMSTKGPSILSTKNATFDVSIHIDSCLFIKDRDAYILRYTQIDTAGCCSYFFTGMGGYTDCYGFIQRDSMDIWGVLHGSQAQGYYIFEFKGKKQ